MGLSESRFNMWRAVVAMVHADNIVQPHEINFILENTKNLPLSQEQSAQLAADVRTPYDINSAYGAITNPRDKEDFFHFARAIAWSDGEFDEREKGLLHKIAALSLNGDDEALLEQVGIAFDARPKSERTWKSAFANLLNPKTA